jgi:hypothetical protein
MPDSYLDVLSHRFEDRGRTMQPLTRVVYAAKLPPKSDHANFLNQLVVDLNIGRVVTGLAIVYDQSVICLVESFPEAVGKFLEGLKAARTEDGGPRMMDARVVVCSEDCPGNVFHSFLARDVPANETDGDADIESEGLADAAYTTYAKMMNIGKRLEEKKLTEVTCARGCGGGCGGGAGVGSWRKGPESGQDESQVYFRDEWCGAWSSACLR